MECPRSSGPRQSLLERGFALGFAGRRPDPSCCSCTPTPSGDPSRWNGLGESSRQPGFCKNRRGCWTLFSQVFHAQRRARPGGRSSAAERSETRQKIKTRIQFLLLGEATRGDALRSAGVRPRISPAVLSIQEAGAARTATAASTAWAVAMAVARKAEAGTTPPPRPPQLSHQSGPAQGRGSGRGSGRPLGLDCCRLLSRLPSARAAPPRHGRAQRRRSPSAATARSAAEGQAKETFGGAESDNNNYRKRVLHFIPCRAGRGRAERPASLASSP